MLSLSESSTCRRRGSGGAQTQQPVPLRVSCLDAQACTEFVALVDILREQDGSSLEGCQSTASELALLHLPAWQPELGLVSVHLTYSGQETDKHRPQSLTLRTCNISSTSHHSHRLPDGQECTTPLPILHSLRACIEGPEPAGRSQQLTVTLLPRTRHTTSLRLLSESQPRGRGGAPFCALSTSSSPNLSTFSPASPFTTSSGPPASNPAADTQTEAVVLMGSAARNGSCMLSACREVLPGLTVQSCGGRSQHQSDVPAETTQSALDKPAMVSAQVFTCPLNMEPPPPSPPLAGDASPSRSGCWLTPLIGPPPAGSLPASCLTPHHTHCHSPSRLSAEHGGSGTQVCSDPPHGACLRSAGARRFSMLTLEASPSRSGHQRAMAAAAGGGMPASGQGDESGSTGGKHARSTTLPVLSTTARTMTTWNLGTCPTAASPSSRFPCAPRSPSPSPKPAPSPSSKGATCSLLVPQMPALFAPEFHDTKARTSCQGSISHAAPGGVGPDSGIRCSSLPSWASALSHNGLPATPLRGAVSFADQVAAAGYPGDRSPTTHRTSASSPGSGMPQVGGSSRSGSAVFLQGMVQQLKASQQPAEPPSPHTSPLRSRTHSPALHPCTPPPLPAPLLAPHLSAVPDSLQCPPLMPALPHQAHWKQRRSLEPPPSLAHARTCPRPSTHRHLLTAHPADLPVTGCSVDLRLPATAAGRSPTAAARALTQVGEQQHVL